MCKNKEDKIYEQEMDVMKPMHPLFIICLESKRFRFQGSLERMSSDCFVSTGQRGSLLFSSQSLGKKRNHFKGFRFQHQDTQNWLVMCDRCILFCCQREKTDVPSIKIRCFSRKHQYYNIFAKENETLLTLRTYKTLHALSCSCMGS